MPNDVPQIMVGKSLQNKQFVLESAINNYNWQKDWQKQIWPLREDSKVKTMGWAKSFLRKERWEKSKEKKHKAINQHFAVI